MRSACPLKRYGEHYYGYIHTSMVEYFATRAMYEEINENKFNLLYTLIASERQQSLHVAYDDEDKLLRNEGYISPRENIQPRGGIHQRVFALELNAITFLADRIQMSEAFKQKMLEILVASKNSKDYAIGAANAITALVRGGITFNGSDLSGINIPGADISGGYFDQTNFEGADLTQVRLSQVWLRQANFEGSTLENINFGQLPPIQFSEEYTDRIIHRSDYSLILIQKLESVAIWDTKHFTQSIDVPGTVGDAASINHLSPFSKGNVLFRPDLNCLFTLNKSEIKKWDIRSGECIATFVGHEDKVTSASLSNDGITLISGSYDGTV